MKNHEHALTLWMRSLKDTMPCSFSGRRGQGAGVVGEEEEMDWYAGVLPSWYEEDLVGGRVRLCE